VTANVRKAKAMTTKIDETRRNKFGNMVIGSWNKNTNDFVWFMSWCTHVPGREGQMTPVFTSDREEAMQFVYADKAKAVIEQIKETWPEMKLFDTPAVWTMCDTGRCLIRAIFGRCEEE
jgi:hypothetical protein